jgi:hypothetical protein
VGENWGTLFDTCSGHRLSFLHPHSRDRPTQKICPTGRKCPAPRRNSKQFKP